MSLISIYGDSIAAGYNATNRATQGWAALLSNTYGHAVNSEALAGRKLYDDCATTAATIAFVAALLGDSPTALWIAIGTNDYGLEAWSADDFGEAYALLLDTLHNADPDLVIYCQTPIDRDDETANTFGDILGAYRTAIEDACASRTWARLIDGTEILATSNLDDGIHPDTAGHAIYAAYVDDILSGNLAQDDVLMGIRVWRSDFPVRHPNDLGSNGIASMEVSLGMLRDAIILPAGSYRYHSIEVNYLSTAGLSGTRPMEISRWKVFFDGE